MKKIILLLLIFIIIPIAFAFHINITLLNPDDNEIVFNPIVDFEFNINFSSNCSLFNNDIIVNSTNLSQGINIFTQNLSIGVYDWFLNCSNTISDTRQLIMINKPVPPFNFCENTIPETIIMIFLLLLSFGFMLLPFITKMKEFFIISGLINIVVGISYLFILCLGAMNWVISILFVGLGLFMITLYFARIIK